MTETREAEVVLAMLHAIAERQVDRLPQFYHPEISFHWPPGLPYGGTYAGATVAAMSQLFRSIWQPLQPTPELRRMDPAVVATGPGGCVVVRYLWRGEAPGVGRHEAETLAEYVVREGRVVRAQMFHFDLMGLLAFLQDARVDRTAPVATGD